MRYIATAAAAFLGSLLLLTTLLATKYWVIRDLNRMDESVGKVTKLAEEKIDAIGADGVDTVFLGDSSLGYAINSSEFDRVSGTRSVNLALTGGHGHAGALVHLRRLAREQPGIEHVILFFNVDLMSSGDSLDGRFFMSPWPVEPALSPRYQVELLRVYVNRLSDWREAANLIWLLVSGTEKLVISQELRDRGYIMSGGRIALDSPHIKQYDMPRQVAHTGLMFLRGVSALCEQNAWNCIYVHGPMIERAIERNEAEDRYLREASRVLGEIGLTLLDWRPLEISDEDRGDTIFHVAKDKRDVFSRRYAELLSPLLNQ